MISASGLGVTFWQARHENPVVNDLLEAKQSVPINEDGRRHHFVHFAYIGAVPRWRIGVYTDAYWATRPDGTSQGSIMVLLTEMHKPNLFLCH